MPKKHTDDKLFDNLIDEMLDDTFELDAEIFDLPKELRAEFEARRKQTLSNKTYYRNLLSLQAEMIKLQDWVINTKAKILSICEVRDSAGKGGVIKRITQRMDPRVARVVALPKPN